MVQPMSPEEVAELAAAYNDKMDIGLPSGSDIAKRVRKAIEDTEGEICQALIDLGWTPPSKSYQERVRAWTTECFEDEVDLNKPTRQAQFLEEVFECAQAAGYPQDCAHQLLDYIYSKPVGDLKVEAGDVMTSFAAFCTAHEILLDECAEEALTRCIANTEKIREKQKTKPFHSRQTQR